MSICRPASEGDPFQGVGASATTGRAVDKPQGELVQQARYEAMGQRQCQAAGLGVAVSFGELAFWLVAKRRPATGECRVFETVLAALADHGFTPFTPSPPGSPVSAPPTR